MPPTPHSATDLEPYLRRCGYGDDQLAIPFGFDNETVPLVAFAGKPWDSWSACIAAVNVNGNDGDSREVAARVSALGAPTVFACRVLGVDWWAIGPSGPKEKPRFIAWRDIGPALERESALLAPSRIYASKLRKPGSLGEQLWFFDTGLMPAVEKKRGEALTRLVVDVITGLRGELGAKLNSRQDEEDVYRTVFWLLAAKILHDKRVPNFKQLTLKDVDEVFDRIGKHHGETGRFPPFSKSGRPAIDAAADRIATCGSLADVSSESLSHVYENALIDKTAGKGKPKKAAESYDFRKELGIHSTPSPLVHHMLAQLWPLIDGIKPDDRHVWEPACGHAPFLTASMRWLRDWGHGDAYSHQYLQSHLHGLEADPFALELAKLALTLADEPHGNKWDIAAGDMFERDVVAKHAKKSRILLSNPPYEPFTDAQRRAYKRRGVEITAQTKAVEFFKRALPALPQGGVFGVVAPRGVMHDKESRFVREILLNECELAEIAVFADNLFEHSDHEVAVLIGRKRNARPKSSTLWYRRVREQGMEAFKDRLAFSSEFEVPHSRLVERPDRSIALPDLLEVWDYLAVHPPLGRCVAVQQGRQYWQEDRLESSGLLSRKRKSGLIEAVLRVDDGVSIYRLPKRVWIDPSRRAFRTQGGGAAPGIPQVLLNYAPVARWPWRLKAVLDDIGIAASSRFIVFRPKPAGPTRIVLWAILNSPVANAYSYSYSGKRETLVGEWNRFPLPKLGNEQGKAIEAAASAYLALVLTSESAFTKPSEREAVKRSLLALDAEVLKLYDLPPRLERQLLDLFSGIERKGVGCDFRGYYPPGFTSALPLHMVISDRFERAAADKTAERFKSGESAYVRDVLSAASAGTGDT